MAQVHVLCVAWLDLAPLAKPGDLLCQLAQLTFARVAVAHHTLHLVRPLFVQRLEPLLFLHFLTEAVYT